MLYQQLQPSFNFFSKINSSNKQSEQGRKMTNQISIIEGRNLFEEIERKAENVYIQFKSIFKVIPIGNEKKEK